MELTNKAHYLLTEYRENLRPILLQITEYIQVINTIPEDVLVGNFDSLENTERILMKAELLGNRERVLAPLRAKIIVLGNKLKEKAGKLLIQHDNHITDMAGNVEFDAHMGELSSEIGSLKSSIIGMGAIVPGGAAGAAILIAENAPTIVSLSKLALQKNEQVTQAATDIAHIAESVVEITNFSFLIATLKLS